MHVVVAASDGGAPVAPPGRVGGEDSLPRPLESAGGRTELLTTRFYSAFQATAQFCSGGPRGGLFWWIPVARRAYCRRTMRASFAVCTVLLAATSIGGFGLAACGAKPPKEPTITETVADAGPEVPPEPPKPKSLYERLGNKEGISKVVDAFLKNLASNEVVKKRFAKLPKDRLEKLRNNLVEQVCKESGGDCEYAGKSMKDSHKGMKVTEAEWNATVSALKAALDENKVGENEQNDLIAAIAPMKDDIVEVKPKGKK
jgi:hemoglobin